MGTRRSWIKRCVSRRDGQRHACSHGSRRRDGACQHGAQCVVVGDGLVGAAPASCWRSHGVSSHPWIRLPVMTMIIGSRCTPSRSGIQESDAAGKLAIRAAPRRDPGLNAEKLEIPTREIRTDLPQMTAFNRAHAVLWNPRGHRHVSNATRAAGPTAARTERLPARHVFAAGQVRLDAGKRRQEGAPDFALEEMSS